MSDQLIASFPGLAGNPLRYKDMGDGTFAEVIYNANASTGGASLADSSIVDANGVYWLVRDNGTTLTYMNWATGIVGMPAAPVAPAGKLTGEQVRGTQYNAIAAGTGYAIGDVVEHIVILNIATTPATILASVWVNITQATVLASAPTLANLVEIAASVIVSNFPTTQPISALSLPLPALAATSANQSTEITALNQLHTDMLAPTPAGTNLVGAFNLDIGGSPISATNPIPMIDAYQAPVATAWTPATPVNTAVAYATNGYDTVIVSVVASAGYASGIVVFEVFDGTNWLLIKAASILNYTTTGATIVPSANSANGYQIPVAGFPQFRVRLAAAMTAGTLGIVTIISSAPDTSLVTVGLDPSQPLPTGTNTLGSVISAYLPPQAWTGTAIDMRGYGSVTINCTVAPTAGTVSVSPDNASDYIGQTLVLNNAAGITTTPNITVAGVYTLAGRGWVQGTFTGGTCFISGGQ